MHTAAMICWILLIQKSERHMKTDLQILYERLVVSTSIKGYRQNLGISVTFFISYKFYIKMRVK
jgi:hypothetical protein